MYFDWKKMGNIQDPMGNVSRETETLRKNQRKYEKSKTMNVK